MSSGLSSELESFESEDGCSDSFASSGLEGVGFFGGGGPIGELEVDGAFSEVSAWGSEEASGCLGGGGPMAVVIVAESSESCASMEAKSLGLSQYFSSYQPTC